MDREHERNATAAVGEVSKEPLECSEPDWNDLESRHAKQLVAELRPYFATPGPFELNVEQLSANLGATADLEADAKKLLLEVFGRSELRYFCPACDTTLLASEAQDQQCSYCRETFADHDGVRAEEWFVCTRPVGRLVKWLLSLHGMNTLGPWQEDFNWLVSRSYGYSVPVAIYKYGVVRPGAFIKFRQQYLKRQVTKQASRLSGEAEGTGFGGKPDVIAHSLGTWLLGHALWDNPELKVGRVILLGSILRPDFRWNELVQNKQVEAVLNNYGTRDFWALIAHYFIPDSGPSGRIGFNKESGVLNIPAPDYGHSSFFTPPHNLKKGFASLWTKFLAEAAESLDRLPGQVVNETNWQQSSLIFRATLGRYLLLLIALVALLFVACAFVVGVSVCVDWILNWL